MKRDDQPSSVARIGALLRALASAGSNGDSTTELARNAGVPRPSAHRILSALLEEGFVDRSQRGRWYLGPELYILGTTAAARYDVSDHARRSVHRLASATAESAFFSAKRGDETVCLLREDGSFPIRSFVLYEGARFPLGVVSSGLAVLAFLPDAEVDRYLERAELSERWGSGFEERLMRERIAATRRTGFALNPGLVVEGSWGMAAAVFDVEQVPRWALTLTGIESRFRPARQAELGKLLLDEAHLLTTALAKTAIAREVVERL